MAQTRDDLLIQVNNLLPNNSAGLISATDVRTVNNSIIDSNLNLLTTDITEVEAGYLKGVTSLIQPQIDGKASLTGADFTGEVTAPDFIGDLNGAVRFNGKAIGSAILAGEVVYISGISGNTPEIRLAQSNSPATMPAFGIALVDIAQNNTGEIATLGSVRGLRVANFGESLITFLVGDILYVSSTEAGKITNVPPAGDANLLQNIGIIQRATPTTNMTIKVGGAGRTNATPNLDSAKIFLGNSSDQSVATEVTGEVTISNTGVTEVTGIDGNISIQGFRPYLTVTAGRTLTVTDSGTFIIADDAASITFEITTNSIQAFTLGTEIDFIQKGAGALSITSVADVFLNGLDSNTVAVTAKWGGVTIKKIAEDEWIAVGKI